MGRPHCYDRGAPIVPGAAARKLTERLARIGWFARGRERARVATGLEARTMTRIEDYMTGLFGSGIQSDKGFLGAYNMGVWGVSVSGKPPLELGWMPIAGEEFVYELTLGMLLLPGSGGVPTWAPQHVGEKSIIKLPEQFAPLFAQGSPLAVGAPNSPLSESHGEALARWSAGEPSAATQTALDPVVANWQTVLEALPTAGEEQVVALNTLSRSVAAAVASGELAEPRLQAVRSLFAGYANAHGLKGGKGGYVRSSR